ncbi:MAG: hypothetical protein LBV79_04090 [Candidatus Adiutrix sp.]|jgi:chromosome segregation ATPase|nr:hypothetical protein [Candidatus Adiutrix sp.]
MKDKLNNDERGIRHAGDLLPAGFDPHDAMRILTAYLLNLETSYNDFKKSSGARQRNLESEYRALTKTKDDQKQELDRLHADLLDLTNTLEDQESQLSTASQKMLNYEKQFKKLHRENSELTNKLTQKENDADFYRQELERNARETETLTSSFQMANMRIDELERRLAVERETGTMQEKENRRLSLMVSESQNKVQITERKLEEAVVKYSEEIKRLTDRSNADAQHEVSLLRKRARSSVAPEMREMEKLMNSKLSIESASNLKALLSRLLSKLEQAGLELK